MKFQEIINTLPLLKSIEELGFVTPTPIQEQAIPKILEGKDLKASAQTGTGKTAAFLLPAISLLTSAINEKRKGPKILILVPTRELAMQVATEAKKYSKYLPQIKTVCIFGGTPYPPQYRELQKPYDILVATPGRLIDHMERGKVNLSSVQMLVLDEADRMLDMGFIRPVENIAKSTPKSRQTLMFSATLQGAVKELSQKLLLNPCEICMTPESETKESIEQHLYHVDDLDHKYRLLKHLLKSETMEQVLIFTATKHLADKVAKTLCDNGHQAAALHGGMRQEKRTKTITKMRQKKIKILVATDVAARGIDILTITHVINFDLPMVASDYIHRIGRTGRAGASGIALSFVDPRTRHLLRDIEKLIEQKIITQVVVGLEPRAKIASQDSQNENGFKKEWKNTKKPFNHFKKRPRPQGKFFSRSDETGKETGRSEETGNFGYAKKFSSRFNERRRFNDSGRSNESGKANDSGRSEETGNFGYAKKFSSRSHERRRFNDSSRSNESGKANDSGRSNESGNFSFPKKEKGKSRFFRKAKKF